MKEKDPDKLPEKERKIFQQGYEKALADVAESMKHNPHLLCLRESCADCNKDDIIYLFTD